VFFTNIITVTKSRSKRRIINTPNMRDMRNAYRVLARKSEEKRTFGRTRHRWKDDIKTNLKQSNVYPS
jgi:hypothetical protein